MAEVVRTADRIGLADWTLVTRPLHPAAPGTPRKTARALRVAGAVLALAGLAAAPLVSPSFVSAAPAVAAENDELASRFTLAVLPDTQFYTRYSASQFMPRYGSDPFRVQTKWLAEHQDELKIPFATHLGDVVDQVGVSSEWQAADVAMKALEDAALDYSILPGNHDVRNSADHVTDIQYNLANEPFLDWFGPDRAATTGTYRGSDPTGLSQYHVFEAEGQKYLVLAMTWRASDQTIAWANDVIDANPTLPVILTTHALIDIENDGVTAKETDYGLKLWNDLISVNDQIFLTLNGHFHGAAKQTKLNSFGHPVTQIVIDYQMAYDGGNGYLGLFEFDLTNDRINVQTASPWVTFKPQESLTAFDQPFLEGQNQQFAIEIDFARRFSGFAPGFSAGEPKTPSLSQAARDILLDGFVGPDPITTHSRARRPTIPTLRARSRTGASTDSTACSPRARWCRTSRARTTCTGFRSPHRVRRLRPSRTSRSHTMFTRSRRTERRCASPTRTGGRTG